jgi:translation initiation factor 1 (eIF-1/SUI1)
MKRDSQIVYSRTVGGSVKDGVIEDQGGHRAVVVEVLKAEGNEPVLAGG